LKKSRQYQLGRVIRKQYPRPSAKDTPYQNKSALILGLINIQEFRVSQRTKFLLKWQGDEITKTSAWQKILAGKKPVVAGEIHLCANHHGLP
jgi:hypothetical protein